MTDSQERPAAPRVDLRRERVAFETDYHRIEGWLVLPKEGYRSRLSDYLNQRDREFFPLEDATLAPRSDPESVQTVHFIMVARAHIHLAVPIEDDEQQQARSEHAQALQGGAPD